MSLPWRAEWHTTEQIADTDPFEGGGVRIDLPDGMLPDDVPAAFGDVFEGVPYVFWRRHAWLDWRGVTQGERDDPQATWAAYLAGPGPSEGVSTGL